MDHTTHEFITGKAKIGMGHRVSIPVRCGGKSIDLVLSPSAARYKQSFFM
jgi:hypothetical protein